MHNTFDFGWHKLSMTFTKNKIDKIKEKINKRKIKIDVIRVCMSILWHALWSMLIDCNNKNINSLNLYIQS